MTPLQKVKSKIKRIRINRNITQIDLSEMCGKSQSWYGVIENNEVELYIEEIETLCRIFNITTAQLLTGTSYRPLPACYTRVERPSWLTYRPLKNDHKFTKDSKTHRELFSYNLRLMMEKKDVSCGWISNKLIATTAMTAKWRRGFFPNAKRLAQLCELFECDFIDFFKRD